MLHCKCLSRKIHDFPSCPCVRCTPGVIHLKDLKTMTKSHRLTSKICRLTTKSHRLTTNNCRPDVR